jgi:hypothetical protein
MNNFLPIYKVEHTPNSQNTQFTAFNAINMPYGSCLLPSNQNDRQGQLGPSQMGVDYLNCIPQVIKPPSVIGPQNTITTENMDKSFFSSYYPTGTNNQAQDYLSNGPTNLQSDRPPEPYESYYVQLAGKSLHVSPDPTMAVFFSDDNINHLRNTVVRKVKEITADSGVAGSAEGVTIKTPNMDDLFYYMVNIYQNYKIHNGSICFINLKKDTDIRREVAKLNTDVLQEYVSKMVSQINMYIYYYKDASQLPEQLSLPLYTSTAGSKSLEYNVGFSSGNSTGMNSYNEVGNINGSSTF